MGLSNHLLDEPWPKVVKGRAKMREALRDDDPAPPLFDLLADHSFVRRHAASAHRRGHRLGAAPRDRAHRRGRLRDAFVDCAYRGCEGQVTLRGARAGPAGRRPRRDNRRKSGATQQKILSANGPWNIGPDIDLDVDAQAVFFEAWLRHQIEYLDKGKVFSGALDLKQCAGAAIFMIYGAGLPGAVRCPRSPIPPSGRTTPARRNDTLAARDERARGQARAASLFHGRADEDGECHCWASRCHLDSRVRRAERSRRFRIGLLLRAGRIWRSSPVGPDASERQGSRRAVPTFPRHQSQEGRSAQVRPQWDMATLGRVAQEGRREGSTAMPHAARCRCGMHRLWISLPRSFASGASRSRDSSSCHRAPVPTRQRHTRLNSANRAPSASSASSTNGRSMAYEAM